MPDRTHIAVAIPAYNERTALAAFLPDLDGELGSSARHTVVCICDDASTDGTAEVARDLGRGTVLSVAVETRSENGGHGAALVDAYRMALATGADVVAQVDGDGQFAAADLVAVIHSLDATAEVSTGVRVDPAVPWYRKVVSRLLRLVLRLFDVRHPDPNVPLRAYRASVLRELLEDVPPHSLVPNAVLTALAADRTVVVTDVHHRERIGGASGTMWGAGTAGRIWRLAWFSGRAMVEIVTVLGRRRDVRHPAP